jgi:hypothetical protein
MQYWERVPWNWLAVVGLALCFTGFVLQGLSVRTAATDTLLVGFILLMVFGLAVSQLAAQRVPGQSRLRLTLTWAWRAAAAGLVLMLATYVMHVTHIGRVARPYLFLSGLGFYVVGLSISGLAFIRPAQGPERLSLLWAWPVGVLGGLLVASGLAIYVIAGAHGLGAALSAVGLVIICSSILVHETVGSVVWLSRATSRTTTWLLILSLVGFIFLFPSFVIFLATNGNTAVLPVSRNNGIGILSILLLASIPLLLVGVPEILRRMPSLDGASDSTKRLLPGWLAVVAALVTALYVLLLHFFSGPLVNVPLGPLCAALLAALALLTPFYKLIAVACWERGVMDIVHLTHWRTSQRLMFSELRTAWRRRGSPS